MCEFYLWLCGRRASLVLWGWGEPGARHCLEQVPTLPPPPPPLNPAVRALGAGVGPGLRAERQAGPAQAARGLAEERGPSGWPWAPAAGARGGVPSARHPFGTWHHCESFFVLFSLLYERNTFGVPLGAPVLRTWHFDCRGPLSSVPGQGPRSHKLDGTAK